MYIHTAIPADTFPLTKLLPSKSNVRRFARPFPFGEEEEEKECDHEGRIISMTITILNKRSEKEINVCVLLNLLEFDCHD